MSNNIPAAEIIDDSTPFELRDLCERCSVQAEFVIELVEAGVLSPVGGDPRHWRFDIHATIRLQKAQRLRRDLRVNIEGIAIALDLIDQLDETQKQLQVLRNHLAQHEDR